MNDSENTRTIHVLDEATVNKIAAGEVVERPASVVKELVENSLDSGADSVTVDIGSDSGGIFRMMVVDNGCGMNRDSALLSLKRHATSKIEDVSDISNIETMGFRGEALASISGVSRLTVITKTHSSKVLSGTKIIAEGGNVIDIGETGSPDGTTVIVENLFFNTPARKKFLKSRQTEFNHIYTVIERIAIANPSVSFRLVHNGKEKISTLKTDSLIETISYIYGKDISDKMFDVESVNSFMRTEGFCSVQNLNYPDSKHVLLSINNRVVASPVLMKAIKSGYGTLLAKDRYPAVFLNIIIDRSIVDVNVHPTKREVRLSREKEIFEEISSAVKKALKSGNVQLDFSSGEKNTFKEISAEESLQKPLFKVESPAGTYDLGDSEPELSGKPDFGYHPRFSATDSQLRLTENFDESENESKLPAMEVIGQYDASYIIANMRNSKGDELVVVDQHAAHERILYDQVIKIRDSGNKSQELLVPVIMTFKEKEAETLSSNLSLLAEEGFVIEEFGKNTFAVRTVPMVLGKRIGTEILKDIISDLLDENLKSLDSKKEKITSTIACRAAIKAGSVLTKEQMNRLLNQLSKTELPYTCPHGRPTMLVFTRTRLDSLFMRS
ncbi:DNA mismatch repair protein MutL [Methanomicrobium sp. W14]|uniref:DNA mismatch repair endonuclease MutL n=1 Tax=Methanomicrobium sp. W14 TaxID=2817839 RepID=UPI001AEB093D|nr:DNA mismatch repair endonuclease MutL [Methanomicrobium sp. W14]MBP2132877.1 DNA mismatch repair protein MutL [Methanomicrobium sp. W14]